MVLQEPLKDLYNADGSVNPENVMREHRFVSWANGRRWKLEHYEKWPEEKLPPTEFYTRKFLQIMLENKDNIHEKIGLDKEAAEKIKKWSWILDRQSLTIRQRDMILATFRKYLKGLPLAEKKMGEFKEENRTREERIADAFLKENSERYKAKNAFPFSLRLSRAICDETFLNATGIDDESKQKILNYKDALSDNNVPQRTLEFFSNTIGGRLKKSPLVIKRQSEAQGRPREFVHVQSSMKAIYRELRTETGEMYAYLRLPHSASTKPPVFSEELLRTVFNDGILKKLNVVISENSDEEYTHLKTWKETIDACKPGELMERELSFNNKQLSSLQMSLSKTLRSHFKEYKASHPEEFPENPFFKKRSGNVTPAPTAPSPNVPPLPVSPPPVAPPPPPRSR